MATDRREQILLRLKQILSAIDDPAAANVYRDRGDLDEMQRPAFVLLDGVEESILDGQSKGRGRISPVQLRLRPQIFAVLRVRPVAESDTTALELSALRMKVLQAILADTDLATLVGNSGDVTYKGMVTDMQTGSSTEGQMQFFFDVDYWLMPEDLV